MTVDERIALARQWLEHSPPATESASGLVGWNGLGVDVCAKCANRIMGRGCDFKQIATKPVWEPETIDCRVCEGK